MNHTPSLRTPHRTRPRRAGFTLVEMLTVVAALIIVLGLMVSLAWDVRRQSSERLTKELLAKLDGLMTQYIARHRQAPQVSAFVESVTTAPPAGKQTPEAAGVGPGVQRPGGRAGVGAAVITRQAEEDLPDESTLVTAAEINNRDFVLALRSEAGAPPELFGPLVGSMYDEVTLRDAWGTPIVFMAGMHPAIGMALGNRPFFFSAGPDRTFRTLEDNLYSYEQGGGTRPGE